ncbi:23S rRNA (adenine(2503)-C(2))-methyltransferase RlmN [Neptunomonas phycophila]|uniref:Dual-specificity RNA methyltransferase RlmN n=1 Tax=Neptunomonas phycophila TaxID=1572645 RepID=A0AAW7XJD9_9GAMM|nr:MULTISPECIES: 23S rRNA (adenine(2503)-C(2))-methyltransferase RlmN [Neptunomonas]MBT3144998.1 23S rRNA (adenine(2503)-C(2))-methyltransferase RlmN [Neptunomonas phycophila]MDN2658495.1 23S rRNA (adenine(2503)-C(2))-methyltransferase RlmN [Neptunomonas sp. CHC150]MDO6454322.1 23S rRNA (adenine(2503)-C(2))-methyltransferase RlmN [Neptunomonas phycophila]MDO6468837.1 23S rRNA (adenine(2503)-C(2))-methyltransferase RlmN [Neptunomonas phycophila]MDP2523092.1 23S rRNA (adenine(2503)-C(2))-methylt
MTDNTTKTNLLGMSPEQLDAFFAEQGEKRFRATQVLKWMHQHGADSFDEMTNISKVLRDKLSKVAEVREPEVVTQDISKDGTRKWVIRIDGGSCVETVLIPEGDRATLCISSQAGCSLDCSFCSTGKQGFNRNLSAAEIIGQLRIAIKSFGPMDPAGPRRVTNVVLMGMGEPLMNFDNVVKAIILMMEDNAYGLSKRRVTLSTAGVVPAIDKLREVTDVSLAISLHAPNDELRDVLVPINKRYPIKELFAACHRYLEDLNDRRVITIEYTLMSGINDQVVHAKELGKLLKTLPCKLNLIPFNPFPNSGYERPSEAAIKAFKDIMLKAGVLTTVRRTRGDEIDAACGQLVGQVEDKTRRSQKYIPVVQESTAEVVKSL